jgi:hypothetical protein
MQFLRITFFVVGVVNLTGGLEIDRTAVDWRAFIRQGQTVILSSITGGGQL